MITDLKSTIDDKILSILEQIGDKVQSKGAQIIDIKNLIV